MRLLITTDTIGGVWTFTKELSLGLLEYGYSVALVSLGRAPNADQQAWADRTIASSHGRFEYHATTSPLEWMQGNAEAFKHSASALEQLAETFKADLIHANQFCFGALATDVPVLITAHSDVLSWAQACNPAALADTPWLAQYKSLVQHGLYAAAGVAAPTPWMLEALAANFKLSFGRFVILNGRTLDAPDAEGELLKPTSQKREVGHPDASRYERDGPERTGLGAPGLASEIRVPADPKRLEIELELKTGVSGGRRIKADPIPTVSSDRKLQAVTAGRLWDEGKNLKLLLEVSSPMPVVIAGEAPPPKTSEGIQFTGQLSEQAILGLFRESAVYVCCSVYEPFGLAPLEAALCGCAVLTNDIPSLRQVWGDAALYFTDARSLQQLLTQLAVNPDELAEAQRRAHWRAEGLSRGSMVARYVRCYREILLSRQESAHAA